MNSHLRPYNRCISNISTNIYLGLDFIPKILISKTRLPKSTIGDEIKNEKVTPRGNLALVNPINSGIDEHEQKGVTVPSKAEMIFAFIP